MIDSLVFADPSLEDTEEFSLGMRELRKRLPMVRRWYNVSENSIPEVDFPKWCDALWVLVILNPALLISDNLLAELIAVTEDDQLCALPSDPRGFSPGVALDYASRPGFDRFVDRLSECPRKGNYDNRKPWIYLVKRTALVELGTTHKEFSWDSVPALLGLRTAVAQRAFAHSYADYHLPTRSEMLRLLPNDTRTLLDVGWTWSNF